MAKAAGFRRWCKWYRG